MTDASMTVFSAIQEHLASATVELFESYGLDVERAQFSDAPAVRDDAFAVTVIGFAGESARGALVVVTQVATVRAWRAAFDGAESGGDVCDTIGEFSNMLLGRLKARLLGEGLTILLSTPTAAIVRNLDLPSSGTRSAWLAFDASDWRFWVRLDASIDDGVELAPTEGSNAPAEAGDILMF